MHDSFTKRNISTAHLNAQLWSGLYSGASMIYCDESSVHECVDSFFRLM